MLSEEERELALAAHARRASGIPLTQADRRVLKKAERLFAKAQRQELLKTVPKGEYAELAGRQVKVLNEQASRYGLPLDGATVDLTKLIPRLHDFLAENRYRLRAPEEEDPMLAGAVSPALEKYRDARYQREMVKLKQDLEVSVPREEVREGFAMVAERLRRLGDKLAERYGEESRELLDACLADCEAGVRELLVDSGQLIVDS